MHALFTAATGIDAQQLRVDIIANNLANVNTTGFKRSRGDFQDLLYQTLRPAGATSSSGTELPSGAQLGQGTRSVSIQKLYVQGDLQKTENQMDLAIEGEGFFKVLQPNGEEAYTRAGSFQRDSQGRIVTSEGYALQPEMTVPPDTVSISVAADGNVTVLQGGKTAATSIGEIRLATFANPAGLNGIGRNLFLPTDASGPAVEGKPGENGVGTIAQGFLENSNVNVAEELVNMIIAQRAYEINSRVVQKSDEMLKFSNNI